MHGHQSRKQCLLACFFFWESSENRGRTHFFKIKSSTNMIRPLAFLASFNQSSSQFLYWRMQAAWWVKGRWEGFTKIEWGTLGSSFFSPLFGQMMTNSESFLLDGKGPFIHSTHFIQFIHIKPFIQCTVHTAITHEGSWRWSLPQKPIGYDAQEYFHVFEQ